jgi:hypothetical protein
MKYKINDSLELKIIGNQNIEAKLKVKNAHFFTHTSQYMDLY